MSKFRSLFTVIFFLVFHLSLYAQKNELVVSEKGFPNSFTVFSDNEISPAILYDGNDAVVVCIAANAFVADIVSIGGNKPELLALTNSDFDNTIIIGTVGHSQLIDRLVKEKKLDVSAIEGKWENFIISVMPAIKPDGKPSLVIAGSDSRGTAFGVFHFSKMIGISPFYWWADIAPQKRNALFVSGTYTSATPSVKYRGIFINDEDWGLQPWAAKTFEPETGDIGPKTYARVFELMLRLKANLIWPAMHDCTKPFFTVRGNAKVAEDYAIVIGSSHAEPMLRNNVGEWDEKKMGHFNYVTNKKNVYNYWEERVQQSVGVNGIFTIGMRGVHDSKMEGVKSSQEAIPLLEGIFNDQRQLLSKYRKKDAVDIPQALTVYKEVLDIYDAGLKVPEDVMLVWPDDNYGYIQRLNNEAEKKRSGGSGVYYHASYWGRPHDYLWLPTAHPALMREEMLKAFNTGADKLWVLNIGDIKPLEYNMEQFLDMAYDITPVYDSLYVQKHLAQWVLNIFGSKEAGRIAHLLLTYYQLAFERKPEFMGWSQTEPTTKTNLTTYNHFFFGDEAQRRIDKYANIEKEVNSIRSLVPSQLKAAFYQLVYYPVVAASCMNKKFLYHDKAVFYAKQNRLSAIDYEQLSQAAYQKIITETSYFNNELSDGKWKHLMSVKPRNLPVFNAPDNIKSFEAGTTSWGLSPEGFNATDSLTGNEEKYELPGFDDVHQQKYFTDIFLSKKEKLNWIAQPSASWITLSAVKGILTPQSGKNQLRIWVSIDWLKLAGTANVSGQVMFKAGGKTKVLLINAKRKKNHELTAYKGFVENGGYVNMYAANYSRQIKKENFDWQSMPALGYTGKALQAGLSTHVSLSKFTDTALIKANNSSLEYDFYTFTNAVAEATIFTLPTHATNNKYSMRYAVAIDDGALQVVDFKTVGRSDEWKQNVLANRTARTIKIQRLKQGKHVLKIYAVDPGVILDEIRINLGGLQKAYGAIAETK